MKYRENIKNGDMLSALGYGCMRFPRKGGRIDQEQVNALIADAIQKGVNYFDTAYIYPGSEEALGKALIMAGARDKVKIATKLPVFLCREPEDFEKLFSKQLDRLQTTWIDYYFIHMLCDTETWGRLKSLGIESWIGKKREENKVRNVGFSFHGGSMAFKAVVDTYKWDFSMVQFNYLDENNQAGVEGVRYAHKKGIPVFAMEPIRGGMLVNGLPRAAKDAFQRVAPERAMASWALRWVLSHPEITLALSGMNTLDQIKENAETVEGVSPNDLTEAERAAYAEAVTVLKRSVKIPCTGCGYCMPCPMGVDIPICFFSYNETYTRGVMASASHYYNMTGAFSSVQRDASKCVRCGKCEKHCPQGIKIGHELENVRKRMGTKWIKPILSVARKVMRVT